jgi:hypothetical protein
LVSGALLEASSDESWELIEIDGHENPEAARGEANETFLLSKELVFSGNRPVFRRHECSLG